MEMKNLAGYNCCIEIKLALGFVMIFVGRLETRNMTVIVRSLKFQPDVRNPVLLYSGISLNVTQQFELKHSSYVGIFRLEGPLTLGPG